MARRSWWGRVVVWAFLILLLLGWAAGTPFLLLGATVDTWGFFAPPTDESRAEAGVWLTGALASGLLLPWAGLFVGVLTGRRRTAWCFGAALVVGAVVIGYYGGPLLVELTRR
jgi:hypothetical protein